VNQVEVEDLEVHYGDLQVLWGVSLEVREADQVVAVIGPNGAGKTTLLKALSGLVEPSGGRIELFGTDLRTLSKNEIVESGFVQVTEERNLFNGLSVYENLRMGAYTEREAFEDTLQEVYEMFPVLEERRDQRVGTLSGGEQQMVAVARGLLSEPDLMLVDEPFEGLMPGLVSDLREVLIELGETTDMSILITSQKTDNVLQFADRALIIQNGSLEFECEASRLAGDVELQERYLGVGR